MKRIFFISFILGIFTLIAKEAKKTTPVKAIIFDIHGVLFEEDSMAFAKKVGLGAISSYTLSHWKNPVNTCLDVLEHMSKDSHHTPNRKFTFKDRQMPHCIVEWQCGRKDYQEVTRTIHSYWDNLNQKKFFKSKKEREITESVVRIALDPATFPEIAKPIQASLKLVRELKKQGYKLYLAGNMPKEPFEIMLKNHPEIKELFDGMHVSSTVGFTTSDSQIFSHIAQQHKLQCHECLVIDDEKGNIADAKKVGMHTVLFTSPKATEKQLKKIGIL